MQQDAPPRSSAKVATRAEALSRDRAAAAPLVMTNARIRSSASRTCELSGTGARARARAGGSPSIPMHRSSAWAKATTARSTRSTIGWLCRPRSAPSISWCRSTTTTPRDLIVAAMPDVLVKGGDYSASDDGGRSGGGWRTAGRFVAIPFAFERSTSSLVSRIRGR
jgi:hypothetical protein